MGARRTGSRAGSWAGGWRVALRLAARDSRRARWRSVFVVAMVGLPALLLAGGLTYLQTASLSPAEQLPGTVGAGQARLTVNDLQHRAAVQQDAYGIASQTVDGASELPPLTTAALATLAGGRLVPVIDDFPRAVVGDRKVQVRALGVDGADPLAAPMTGLESGRWPSAADEVVVTAAGRAKGLPGSGTVRLVGQDGTERTARVVGIGWGQLPYGPADLVARSQDLDNPTAGYLLDRAAPVDWAEVRRLNEQGVVVASRAVTLDPAQATDVPDELAQQSELSDGVLFVIAVGAVGLFVQVALMAGPAFAVGAARQRRTLALAAANGATGAQLRRTVLGQAVVLGALAAVIGVACGTAIAAGAVALRQRLDPTWTTGPLEVPWGYLALVLVAAVLACVVAALVPAVRVARSDIAGVLAGRAPVGRVRRGLPVLGVVVMAGSAALVFLGAMVKSLGQAGVVLVGGGAVGLVLGCLMVVPAILVVLGRLGTRLALPLRLACRDASRQRSRATPAVAAVMAAVAALVALSVAAASDEAARSARYQPSAPMGTGVLRASSQDLSAEMDVVRRYAPDLVVAEQGAVTTGDLVDGQRVTVLGAVPAGCTPERSLSGFATGAEPHATCTSVGTAGTWARGDISTGSLATADTLLRLTADERAVLDDGGMLVRDPGLVQDGRIRVAEAPAVFEDDPGLVVDGPVTTRTLPGLAVDPARWDAAFPEATNTGAWMLPQTATALGWTVRPSLAVVSSPTGPISAAQEVAIVEHLDAFADFYVERGFVGDSAWIVNVLFLLAAALVLVAALLSTALAQAESQGDLATLAAVGATRRTRRAIAGAQALFVAGVGGLLGIVIGMVPGLAATWPLTAGAWSDGGSAGPTIVVPWTMLLGVAVVVPLVAAAVAWLGVRRPPTLTRRLA